MCVCHVGVNTDVVKVDKGNSIHLQFEDKSVNIDDVQQGSLDETKNEVAHLKQENVPLREKLLKVTSPVVRMEGDDDQTCFLTGLPSYAVFASLFQWWYQPH